MKCPSCGKGLVRDTRDVPYIYKGETTTILAVRGEFCPACGETVLPAAAIFGGGPNAFSRYENGKTKPPLALVKLLMVLDRRARRSRRVRA